MATSSQAQTTLNVTNFGARGDAVQFYVNTTSNSTLVTTTNQLSSADIGKVVELFGAGPLGTSTNHQDLLATITNVVNATNLYISQVAGATTNGCAGAYGTQNATAFQNCINAAPSNSIINVPDGIYLFADTNDLNPSYVLTSPYTPPAAACFNISHGGITLMGQSESGTILMHEGAWLNKGGYVYRGEMVNIQTTNTGPVAFENMTIDGGVQQGMTAEVNSYPASSDTGDGWDVTHKGIYFGTYDTTPHFLMANVHMRNWRGEQLYSNNGGWDVAPGLGPAGMFTNCIFSDGDGTGFNYQYSHWIINCFYYNLAMADEDSFLFCSNASVFAGNIVSNVATTCLAINDERTNGFNPPYYVSNNTFYVSSGYATSYAGVATSPCQNLYIQNNLFIGSAQPAIALGTAGQQPADGSATINSNIVIVGNICTNNSGGFILIEGTGMNLVDDLYASNNMYYGVGGSQSFFAGGWGFGTNMFLFNNYATNTGWNSAVYGNLSSGQWYYDDLADNFPYFPTGGTGTNVISYFSGARQLCQPSSTGVAFAIDDNSPAKIPPGARMIVSNTTYTATLLTSTTNINSVTPITMAPGYAATFQWTNGVWVNISGATNAAANPVIQVTPGSIAYATVLSGTSATNSFTVQNIGGGTLSGAASVAAPFSILSGGSYNLSSNQSQTVTVVFSPSAAGSYNQSVTLTGASGASASVSGSATNAPPIPAIQLTPGSIAYGTLLTGTSKTNSFTVQNVGGGTLTGAAGVAAPFSILSGGSYNLASNQSQTVTVVFSPSAAGSYNQSVTLTGASGASASVSGSATNAPSIPAIQVTPGSIAYGTLLTGTSGTNSFTVKNVGGGTLTGAVGVAAPFSILSGGSYNLNSNQSQTVTVVFSPSAAGSYNQSVTFTGGTGTNATVAGTATNIPPTVSAITANVPDVDTNMAGYQIYVGTTVQLSASASAPNGDALIWQWSYSTNGVSQIAYQSGSGTAPASSFTYPIGTAGTTYVWTLQVTDSQTQLSAQSQLTLFVELVPPQGLTIMSP